MLAGKGVGVLETVVPIYLVVSFLIFGFILWRLAREVTTSYYWSTRGPSSIDHVTLVRPTGGDVSVAAVLALAWPVALLFALLMGFTATLRTLEARERD